MLKKSGFGEKDNLLWTGSYILTKREKIEKICCYAEYQMVF